MDTEIRLLKNNFDEMSEIAIDIFLVLLQGWSVQIGLGLG